MLKTFTMTIEVRHEDDLIAAAKKSFLENGMTEEDWNDFAGDDPVGPALIQLLDPGSLDGCKILDSHVTDE